MKKALGSFALFGLYRDKGDKKTAKNIIFVLITFMNLFQ